jgi:hypothetical protein
MNNQEFKPECYHCGELLKLTREKKINPKIHFHFDGEFYHNACQRFERKGGRIPNFGCYKNYKQ